MCLKIFLSAFVFFFVLFDTIYDANSATENGEKLPVSNEELNLLRNIPTAVSKLLEKLEKEQRGDFKKGIGKIKRELGSGKFLAKIRSKFPKINGQKNGTNANTVPQQSLDSLKQLLEKIRKDVKAIVEKTPPYNNAENFKETYNQELEEVKKNMGQMMRKNMGKKGGKKVDNSAKAKSNVSGAGPEPASLSPAVSAVVDAYMEMAAIMSMMPNCGKGCKKGAETNQDDDDENGVRGKDRRHRHHGGGGGGSFLEGCLAALCCCWILEACV